MAIEVQSLSQLLDDAENNTDYRESDSLSYNDSQALR